PDEIEWLIEAEPAVAARMLRCLAAALAARNAVQPLGAGATPEVPTEVEEPSALARLADTCQEAKRQLAAMGPAPEEGSAFWARERIPAVATIYRPVLRALAGLLDSASPSERPR